MTVWAGWHVLESLAPGTRVVVVRVSVTGDSGRTGSTVGAFPVTTAAGRSDQDLTPTPSSVTGDGVDDANGPVVSIQAPETPTSVALGTLPQPNLAEAPCSSSRSTPSTCSTTASASTRTEPASHPSGSSSTPPRSGPTGRIGTSPASTSPSTPPCDRPAGTWSRPGRTWPHCSTSPAVRTTADWVVGGALVLPDGQSTLTITARVTDNAGRTGSQAITVGISPATSGQDLTPAP